MKGDEQLITVWIERLEDEESWRRDRKEMREKRVEVEVERRLGP